MLDIAALNSWVIYKKVIGEQISSRNFILGLVESWTTKNVAKRASLRPDSISSDLPPPKRRKYEHYKNSVPHLPLAHVWKMWSGQ